MLHQRLMIAALVSMSLAFAPTGASADDCAGSSVVYVRSAKASTALVVEARDRVWRARWLAGPEKGREVVLGNFGEDVHLTIFQRDDNSFALLNGSGGRHDRGRLIFYDAKARPLETLGLKEILGDDVKLVTRSTSHVWWYNPKGSGLQAKGKTLRLNTTWGAVIHLSWPKSPADLPKSR